MGHRAVTPATCSALCYCTSIASARLESPRTGFRRSTSQWTADDDGDQAALARSVGGGVISPRPGERPTGPLTLPRGA